MFVHQGTVCRTSLITLYGTWDEVNGWVQSCRYINGHIHELEVRFVQKIDPSLYCAEAVACRVLLVEDDLLTARMIGAWLKQLNASVEHVADGRAALEAASQNQFDLVLMDLDLPVMDGFKASRGLRSAGYCGRVTAISSLSTPKVQTMCLHCGCDTFLAKPFSRDDLAELLASLREEPIFSTLPYAEVVEELITEFVKELPPRAQALQDALHQHDPKALQTIVRMLKSQGSIYGFECITTAAVSIEAAMAKGAFCEDVRQSVNEMRRICARVRPAVRPSRPAQEPIP
jgi:CheY-like chemotaxis protein